jgi:hypothetical protein
MRYLKTVWYAGNVVILTGIFALLFTVLILMFVIGFP